MKKKLILMGLLCLFSGAYTYAQTGNVLCHVGSNAKIYVAKNATVYNGGGLKLVDNAIVENHGNVMIVGGASDIFVTFDNSGNAKTEANGGGNFINRLNEPDNYNKVNTSTLPSQFTYGQLYISGLTQDNVTAIVDQEYRQVKHGAFQQISLPFFNKTFSTLSTEFNKTFTNTRWSQNEILRWNNANVVFDFVSTSTTTTNMGTSSTSYYALGSNNLDASSKIFIIKGVPFTEENVPNVTIKDAGLGINFGANGDNRNAYNEKYLTYVQDGFHMASGGTAWQVADSNGRGFGKNIYQFGNPFLTNLDLSKIADNEVGTTSDGNSLSNIYGLRLEVSGVQYTKNGGSSSADYKYVTFTTGAGKVDANGNPIISTGGGTASSPVGDLEYMMVRPMGTFVIKYKDNSITNQVLNFKTLRRFNYLRRDATTNYSVSAARTSARTTASTVKQLGIIALDANGNEIGRTYYVVYPNAVTGHSTVATSQVNAFSHNVVGTYEEAPQGGYDNNYKDSYWLYINEANEADFKGKNIKLLNYSSDIKSYKFEIRENANLVDEGTHTLSSGEGFYLRPSDVSSDLIEVKQGEVVAAAGSVEGVEYDLYYGVPDSGTLGTSKNVKPSRTKIMYVEEAKKYIVKFDPNWKKADVYVHDMSGKLILSEKSVSAKSDYVIELNSSVNGGYIINVISELGEQVTSKIIK